MHLPALHLPYQSLVVILDLSHELVQIQKLGESSAQFEQAKAAAYKLHGQVPGATSVDALKIYGATYSMFGHEGALKTMKPLAEFAQVMGNTSGDYKKAFDNLYDMVRGGELMGKFLNESTHLVDTDKLTHFLELGSKVVQATHGKVSAQTWFGMAQQGGPALSMLDDNGMLTMAMVSQAMGGQRAGTALSSMFQQMAGGKMTQYAAQLLSDKYHLLGGYQVGRGGHLVWDKGALDPETHPFIKAMGKDPLEAVRMLKDKMGEGGLSDMEHIIPELYQMLGRNTTQRLVHDLMRNLPQLIGERERMKGGLGTAESLSAQDKDYTYVEQKYDAAKQEMLMHIGLPMMQSAIPILQQITKFFDSIGDFAKANPKAMENIGNGILVLGGSLAVASGLALAAAISPAGWLVLGIGALGAAFVAFPETKFEDFTGLMKRFGDWLAGGVVKDIELMISLLDKLAKTIGGFIDDVKKYVGGLFSKTSYDGGGFGSDGLLHRVSLGSSSGGGSDNKSWLTATGSNKDHLDYIRAGAIARGIDPNVVSQLVANEGLGNYVGDGGTSFGDFQLHTGGGLGDIYQRQTGHSLHNPGDWKHQADWALDWMAAHKTLKPWHGWHGSPRAGLSGAHAAPYHKPATHVHIENVMVLDGDVVHRSVTKRIVNASTHPTTGPYFDSSRHSATPDMGTIGV